MKFEIEFDEKLARAEVTYPNGAKKSYVAVSIRVDHPIEFSQEPGDAAVFQHTGQMSIIFTGTEIKTK